jgi:hypothetical protein
MADEYDGLGGSYVVDPKSGKRKLVERTREAAEVPPAPAEPETEE